MRTRWAYPLLALVLLVASRIEPGVRAAAGRDEAWGSERGFTPLKSCKRLTDARALGSREPARELAEPARAFGLEEPERACAVLESATLANAPTIAVRRRQGARAPPRA